MIYQTILTSQDGPARVLTLNRPDKRNAVSTQMMQEIIDELKAAEADETVRAVIITGGASFFSAGADLNEALQVKSAAQSIDYFRCWHRLNTAIEELAKPVIAAIEGFCITGGLEFALACDLRVAGDGASFAVTSSRIGTVAGAGGTQRLPRIVGVAHALEHSVLGRADRCTRGAPHRPRQQARCKGRRARRREEARGRVRTARAAQPCAGEACGAPGHADGSRLRNRSRDFSRHHDFYGTEDKQEGISAFLEKRTAQFKGK